MRALTHQHRLLYALAATALALALCGATPAHAQDAGNEPSFPDPAHSNMPEGAFVNVENLRKVAPGLTKHQLYDLLGTPHFSEGVFGVRQWNYIFAFRVSDGDVIRCQYQVQFDKQHVAQAFYWKPASCKSLLEPPAPPPVPAPAAAPMAITLSSDAMFGFDSATLTPEGKANLDGLLSRVQEASRIQNIMITGYTDRIGSDSYNLTLSQRRADAVRQYLAEHGVSPATMMVDGRGPADPVVQCDDKQRSRLIACLAPNRRVELKGSAR